MNNENLGIFPQWVFFASRIRYWWQVYQWHNFSFFIIGVKMFTDHLKLLPWYSYGNLEEGGIIMYIGIKCLS